MCDILLGFRHVYHVTYQNHAQLAAACIMYILRAICLSDIGLLFVVQPQYDDDFAACRCLVLRGFGSKAFRNWVRVSLPHYVHVGQARKT